MMKFRMRFIAMASSLMIGFMPLTAFANVPDNVDTSVIDDEEVEGEPLTPDGNLTLVDDIESNSETSKQFMTVTTKNGNIFYIIVDRSAQGTNTVHFLNQVDERDLMDLLSDEDKEAIEEQTGAVVDIPTVEEAAEEENPVDVEEKKASAKTNPMLYVFIVLGIAGAGGFYWYNNRDSFKSKKKKGEDPDSGNADDTIEIKPEQEK